KQNGAVRHAYALDQVGDGSELSRIVAIKQRTVALMAFRKAVSDPILSKQERVGHVVPRFQPNLEAHFGLSEWLPDRHFRNSAHTKISVILGKEREFR